KIDPTIIFATLKDIQDLDTKIGTVNTKIDTTKTELTSNIEIAKTELSNKIGDTTQLTTTDKTNIVSAINEVKTSVDSIETTAEKTSIKDTDNLFESDNVEGALKELANKQNELNTEVNGQRTKGITIANDLIDMI
ncbi:TPA: phage tail protein, partial [Clostridioides difficile]